METHPREKRQTRAPRKRLTAPGSSISCAGRWARLKPRRRRARAAGRALALRPARGCPMAGWRAARCTRLPRHDRGARLPRPAQAFARAHADPPHDPVEPQPLRPARIRRALRPRPAAFGLDPASFLFVDATSAKDTLWTIEEGARAGCLLAVVGETSAPDFKQTQRLSPRRRRDRHACASADPAGQRAPQRRRHALAHRPRRRSARRLRPPRARRTALACRAHPLPGRAAEGLVHGVA